VPFQRGCQYVLVFTGTGSRQVAGRALRVVAVGSGVALGLDGWFTSFKLRSAGWPQLEAVGLLLMLGVLSARAVPGVRWVAALTGVVATAAACSAATAADWFVDHLWYHTVLATGSRLLFAASVVVVAWAVAAVLLRYSDGLLPGPAIRSVRRGAVRAAPVGGSALLGVTLFGGTLTLVGYFLGGPDRFADSVFESYIKTLLVRLAVWALVVVAVSRPAGLRARDSIFLVGAGLVAYPLYLLPSILQGLSYPRLVVAVSATALAAGLTVGLWATRPTQPNALEEPVAPVG
jgi:hypothetical protein